jgi:hypothetical protein
MHQVAVALLAKWMHAACVEELVLLLTLMAFVAIPLCPLRVLVVLRPLVSTAVVFAVVAMSVVPL